MAHGVKKVGKKAGKGAEKIGKKILRDDKLKTLVALVVASSIPGIGQAAAMAIMSVTRLTLDGASAVDERHQRRRENRAIDEAHEQTQETIDQQDQELQEVIDEYTQVVQQENTLDEEELSQLTVLSNLIADTGSLLDRAQRLHDIFVDLDRQAIEDFFANPGLEALMSHQNRLQEFHDLRDAVLDLTIGEGYEVLSEASSGMEP